MKYYNLFVESSREPDKRFIWIKKQVPYYYAAEGWTPLRALGKAEKIDWDDILEKPNLVTEEELEETFKGYYTKTEIDDLLSKKLDKTTYEAFLKTYGEFLKSHEKHVEDFNDHVKKNKKHEEEYRQHLLDLEERDWKQDAEISKNKQDINNLEDTIKLLDTHDTEIGTAEGGNIISLPENVQSSVTPSYKFEGLTLTNLIKNGDFSDGSESWGKHLSCTFTEGQAIVEKHPDSNILALSYIGSNIKDLTSIFYIAFKLKNVNIGDKEIALQARDPNKMVMVSKYSPKTNESFMFSGVYDGTISQYIRVVVSDASEKDNFICESLVVHNLTQAFGAGNEPTKEWCDEHIQGYFEGTKSVTAPLRIKSEIGGRNLIKKGDVKKEDYFIDDSKVTSFPTKRLYICVAPIDSNSFYSISIGRRSDQFRWGFLDEMPYIGQDVYGSRTENGVGTPFSINGIKSGADSKYIIIYLAGGYKYGDQLKLEKGNKATPWTPAPEDNQPATGGTAYITNEVNLSRVGKVFDYIEDGKLYKNIKRYYFTGKEEWTFRGDYTGDNFRYFTELPFNYKATGSGVKGELLCNNFTPTSNVGGKAEERDSNTIALYRGNDSKIYLTLDKKVDDVNSVIPEGTFIDVILPQTEVSNLNTSGLITNHPNGTIVIEPVTNLTAFYNDGLDVSKLTIKEVGSFSVFKDGNYQDLDISKVSIKDGKLTHPDAINGLCYLVYRYDDSPIYGVNSVDYYNSDKTLKSPNGKIWKKVERATDDGELEVVLEEVVVKEPEIPEIPTEPEEPINQ